ncbi:NAD(P)-binding protein [Wolfiporia cocos MD-104 SS10]|uniref:NAD(P)-binding protein n=1 Tax=Wolfiporia cocos (strain MD-104) TaxID=742152 RepID=A0A2H3JHI1_WOLCO|nr:NAD(P)-binding protein [Wolfiporia cocos MD-104 SS10]
MASFLPDTTNVATLLSRRFRPENIPDLSGRVAIVTGGSAGIGYYDALALARANARVLIVSANEEHGKQAEADLNTALKEASSTGTVTWHGVDFGTLKAVDSLAKQIAEQEDRLDILICNAGIGQAPHGLTGDGLGRHFEVNNLAHYVFVNRLLPLMKKTTQIAPPTTVRIVMQSSEMHRLAPSTTKFLSKEEINQDGDGAQLYGRTKLGLIYFARELVKRKLGDLPPATPIIVTSVHPGTVDTDVQKQWHESYGPVGKVIEVLSRAAGKSAEEGAEASLWAATSTDIFEGNWKDFQGNYYSEPYGKPGTESKLAQDAQNAANFWELCASLTREMLGEELR